MSLVVTWFRSFWCEHMLCQSATRCSMQQTTHWDDVADWSHGALRGQPACTFVLLPFGYMVQSPGVANTTHFKININFL